MDSSVTLTTSLKCNIHISMTHSSEEMKTIHYIIINVAVMSEKLSHLIHRTAVQTIFLKKHTVKAEGR